MEHFLKHGIKYAVSIFCITILFIIAQLFIPRLVLWKINALAGGIGLSVDALGQHLNYPSTEFTGVTVLRDGTTIAKLAAVNIEFSWNFQSADVVAENAEIALDGWSPIRLDDVEGTWLGEAYGASGGLLFRNKKYKFIIDEGYDGKLRVLLKAKDLVATAFFEPNANRSNFIRFETKINSANLDSILFSPDNFIATFSRYAQASTGPVYVKIMGTLPETGNNSAEIIAKIGSDHDGLKLSGTVSNIMANPNLSLQIEAAAKSVGTLVDMTGSLIPKNIPLRKAGPIKIKGDVGGRLSSPYVHNISAFLGVRKTNGIRIDGAIQSDQSFEFNIKGSGNNLAKLFPDTPLKNNNGTFRVQSSVKGDANVLRILDLSGSIKSPALKLFVKGNINPKEVGGHLEGNIQVSDVATVRHVLGVDIPNGYGDVKFLLDGVSGIDPLNAIFSDGGLSYITNSVSGKIRFKYMPQRLPISSLNVALHLKPGEVVVSEAKANIKPRGFAYAKGRVLTRNGESKLSGNLLVKGLDLSGYSKGLLEAFADADASFRSVGVTKDLVKNLNGKGQIDLIGSIDTSKINGTFSDLFKETGAPYNVVPRLSYRDGKFNCVIAPFSINQGTIKVDRWVIGTNGLLVNSHGKLDLNSFKYSLTNDVAVGRKWRSLRGEAVIFGRIGETPSIEKNGFIDYVTNLVINKKAADARNNRSRGLWALTKNVLGGAACLLANCEPPFVREGMYKCR